MVAALAALGVLALITGLPMYSAYRNDGVAGCLAANDSTASCTQIVDAFRDKFSRLPTAVAGQLNFAPMLVAVLVGAPLLAREYEQGTWQLACTQAVPRTRWAAMKIVLVVGVVGAVALGLSAVLGWWVHPLGSTPFSVERFNYGAPVLTGYFLLAVAVGILAGTIIRRAIPAMVAALAVFLPIRLLVEFWLRPRYLTPETIVGTEPGDSDLVQGVLNGDGWVLDSYLVGPLGDRLSDSEEFDLLGGGGIVEEATLVQHGLREAVSYHPAGRFWEFQFIEMAIFSGLALACVLLAIWRVRRW
jgi:uncharacterized membrane protein